MNVDKLLVEDFNDISKIFYTFQTCEFFVFVFCFVNVIYTGAILYMLLGDAVSSEERWEKCWWESSWVRGICYWYPVGNGQVVGFHVQNIWGKAVIVIVNIYIGDAMFIIGKSFLRTKRNNRV